MLAFEEAAWSHLAIEEQCPEFGLTRLTEALRGVQDVDQRGSHVFIVGTHAKAAVGRTHDRLCRERVPYASRRLGLPTPRSRTPSERA